MSFKSAKSHFIVAICWCYHALLVASEPRLRMTLPPHGQQQVVAGTNLVLVFDEDIVIPPGAPKPFFRCLDKDYVIDVAPTIGAASVTYASAVPGIPRDGDCHLLADAGVVTDLNGVDWPGLELYDVTMRVLDSVGPVVNRAIFEVLEERGEVSVKLTFENDEGALWGNGHAQAIHSDGTVYRNAKASVNSENESITLYFERLPAGSYSLFLPKGIFRDGSGHKNLPQVDFAWFTLKSHQGYVTQVEQEEVVESSIPGYVWVGVTLVLMGMVGYLYYLREERVRKRRQIADEVSEFEPPDGDSSDADIDSLGAVAKDNVDKVDKSGESVLSEATKQTAKILTLPFRRVGLGIYAIGGGVRSRWNNAQQYLQDGVDRAKEQQGRKRRAKLDAAASYRIQKEKEAAVKAAQPPTPKSREALDRQAELERKVDNN